MKYLSLMAVAFYGFNSWAGGIEWRDLYEGVHPVTRTKVTVEIKDRRASITVADTISKEEDLVVPEIADAMTRFERVFRLRRNGERGVIATFITTYDCQIVQGFLLAFPGGTLIPMRVVPRK